MRVEVRVALPQQPQVGLDGRRLAALDGQQLCGCQQLRQQRDLRQAAGPLLEALGSRHLMAAYEGNAAGRPTCHVYACWLAADRLFATVKDNAPHLPLRSRSALRFIRAQHQLHDHQVLQVRLPQLRLQPPKLLLRRRRLLLLVRGRQRVRDLYLLSATLPQSVPWRSQIDANEERRPCVSIKEGACVCCSAIAILLCNPKP